MKETDLYLPVHDYLVKHGYQVRSEVKDCDITAVKDDDLLVIELKKSLNITLLMQATQRQKITESVYVAVPEPRGGVWSKKWRKMQHLLKRLELGLLVVAFRKKRTSVQVVFHPLPFDPKKSHRQRRAVLREIENRSVDMNQGGSVGAKLMTAYRESAIHIACVLNQYGSMTPKKIREYGTGPKTLAILYDNHYGWFDRVQRGIYALSAKGKEQIEAHFELAKHYQDQLPKSDE